MLWINYRHVKTPSTLSHRLMVPRHWPQGYGQDGRHPRAHEAREVVDALRFVEVWELAGHMSPEEADAWRRRIEAWARFRCGGSLQTLKPTIVEPPDQFLS